MKQLLYDNYDINYILLCLVISTLLIFFGCIYLILRFRSWRKDVSEQFRVHKDETERTILTVLDLITLTRNQLLAMGLYLKKEYGMKVDDLNLSAFKDSMETKKDDEANHSEDEKNRTE